MRALMQSFLRMQELLGDLVLMFLVPATHFKHIGCYIICLCIYIYEWLTWLVVHWRILGDFNLCPRTRGDPFSQFITLEVFQKTSEIAFTQIQSNSSNMIFFPKNTTKIPKPRPAGPDAHHPLRHRTPRGRWPWLGGGEPHEAREDRGGGEVGLGTRRFVTKDMRKIEIGVLICFSMVLVGFYFLFSFFF